MPRVNVTFSFDYPLMNFSGLDRQILRDELESLLSEQFTASSISIDISHPPAPHALGPSQTQEKF